MRSDVAIVVGLFLVILLVLGIVAWLGHDRWIPAEQVSGYQLQSAEAQPIEKCMDAETRELVRGLMVEGLSAAFREHVEHTYTIWVRDSTGQPGRARVGVNQGVNAFVQARAGVLAWMPPECAG